MLEVALYGAIICWVLFFLLFFVVFFNLKQVPRQKLQKRFVDYETTRLSICMR